MHSNKRWFVPNILTHEISMQALGACRTSIVDMSTLHTFQADVAHMASDNMIAACHDTNKLQLLTYVKALCSGWVQHSSHVSDADATHPHCLLCHLFNRRRNSSPFLNILTAQEPLAVQLICTHVWLSYVELLHGFRH